MSEEDTLPQWLHRRFGPERAWGSLRPEDQAYWVHEAAAVRRAVERGGFKRPLVGTQVAEEHLP